MSKPPKGLSKLFKRRIVREVWCRRDGAFVRMSMPPRWVWAMRPCTAVSLASALSTQSGVVDVEGIVVRLHRAGGSVLMEVASYPGLVLLDPNAHVVFGPCRAR